MLFRFLFLIFLHGVTLASIETIEIKPEISDIDFNSNTLSLRSPRALWNPTRFITPIFGRFLHNLIKSSMKLSGKTVKRNDPPGVRAPQEGEGLSVHKMLESFGFAQRHKSPRAEICSEVGGVLINGECQQYFGKDFRRSFEEARAFCKSRGGDLWTPDLRDPFLYQKLMKYIPQIAAAKGEDLWLGAFQYNTRAFTVNGEDVTDAYLLQIYDGSYIDGQCFILDYPNGQFVAKDIDCRAHQEFICEYPLSVENEI